MFLLLMNTCKVCSRNQWKRIESKWGVLKNAPISLIDRIWSWSSIKYLMLSLLAVKRGKLHFPTIPTTVHFSIHLDTKNGGCFTIHFKILKSTSVVNFLETWPKSKEYFKAFVSPPPYMDTAISGLPQPGLARLHLL